MTEESENKRIEELIEYGVINTMAVADLDEITKLASVMCETPISLITLVDDTRVWCISKQGVDSSEFKKEKSMCQYTIQQQDLYIVHDLLLDDKYKHIAIELGNPLVRFYAGMPLVSSNGYSIGTLCILDYEPRILNENQKFLIKALAKQVITNFELRKTNKELLKLNGKILLYKEKEEFYGNMSHELRTPLNAISGFTDLLSTTKLDEKQKEQLAILRSSIDILISIVNDILDYSKIESGHLKIENHTFNIRSLINTVYELFKIKAQEKNIAFNLDISDSIPSYINGDKLRLNQILINLLGNALKFTSKGFVELRINILSDSEKEIELDFCVKDTGIGIPPDKLNDIFERFHQIEGTTRVFGGTGLGLSITKNLVELQGGKIEVRSELEKYSKFSFSLKYEKSTTEEIFKKENYSNQLPSKKDFKNFKILLAEDNLVNVKLIEKVFEGTGIQMDYSQNGKLCIEKLKQSKYDLILMDMFMPEMNGCEATKYIRETMMLNIPIIALSANISELNKKKCLDAGMDDYISKPFKINELFNVINKFYKNDDVGNKENEFGTDKIIPTNSEETNSFIKIQSLPTPIVLLGKNNATTKLIKHKYESSPDLSSSIKSVALIDNNLSKSKPKSVSHLSNEQELYDKIELMLLKEYLGHGDDIEMQLDSMDIGSLKEYSGNDKEFEKELIKLFLLEVPEYLQDLQDQILNENYDTIKNAAHKLKSPMGFFGLVILKNNFQQIEELSEQFKIVPIKKILEFSKNNLSKIFSDLKNLQ